MDVEPSARRHNVDDDDMTHALRHHSRAFETNDPTVTMFIGPARSGDPLEVGVVDDDNGMADAGPTQVPERLVDTMTTTRAQRAAALEEWADTVDTDDLVVANTDALRLISELAEQREGLDEALAEAVRTARGDHRSWSEIGTMLGVSKQAAQRKYAHRASA